jgi:hypothetical protein
VAEVDLRVDLRVALEAARGLARIVRDEYATFDYVPFSLTYVVEHWPPLGLTDSELSAIRAMEAAGAFEGVVSDGA